MSAEAIEGVRFGRPDEDAQVRAWRLPRNIQFWAGLTIVSIAIGMALLAPFVAPYDPLVQDIYNRYEGPSSAHWLGQDEFGRDILSRLMHGARITLSTAVIAIAIAVPAGAVIGA